MTRTLTPGKVTLADLEQIYWNASPTRLDPSAHAGIDRAAARIAEVAAGNEAVYGVNGGYAKLAWIQGGRADGATRQRYLTLSHCAGGGPPLPAALAPLSMAL